MHEPVLLIIGTDPFSSCFKGPKRPVENVNWHDCQKFLEKLRQMTGRTIALPTEAQWEYACRAGTTTRYSFGDSEASLAEYGWFGGNSSGTTHPVGEKKPNPWGLYDMHGNVCEWCAGGHSDAHSNGDVIDAPGASSDGSCAVCGGAWYIPAISLRSSYHHSSTPDFRVNLVGFRCVLITQMTSSFALFLLSVGTCENFDDTAHLYGFRLLAGSPFLHFGDIWCWIPFRKTSQKSAKKSSSEPSSLAAEAIKLLSFQSSCELVSMRWNRSHNAQPIESAANAPSPSGISFSLLTGIIIHLVNFSRFVMAYLPNLLE